MSANTPFKVENGIIVRGANSTFEQRVFINDILTVNSDAVFITGNLVVTGNLNYSNTTVAGDMYPAVNGLALGNNSNRFTLFATDITTSGAITPNTTNGTLGSDSKRWFVYSTNTDIQHTLIANNVLVSGNLIFANSSTRRVGVNAVPSGTAALQVQGDVSITANLTSNNITASTLNVSNNVLSFTGGAIVTNTATISTSPQVVDAFAKATCKLAKYLVRVANTTTGIHGAEIIVANEGTNVLMTIYGEVAATELGIFDANINGANVELTYAGTTGETVKVIRTQVIE